MQSLVLASSSPRRAALLSEAGFEFEILPPGVAEKFNIAFTLRELTVWNAIGKGMSIAQRVLMPSCLQPTRWSR